MNSFTVKSYWKSYKELSENIQKQADAKFELWKENPFHPSLRFIVVAKIMFRYKDYLQRLGFRANPFGDI
jgi:mRNA-degrading endonuclease RelE of RelBE toxin-antitoxin system